MSFSISNDLKNYLTSITLCKFDFNLGLAQVEQFFESGYAPLKKDWLYMQVYPMSKLEWSSFCKDICGRFERMPNVKQIVDVGLSKFRTAKEIRITRIEAFYSEKGIKKCQFCDHTGIINAWAVGTKDKPYAFRCALCEFSKLRGLSSLIPEWDESYEYKFIPSFKIKTPKKEEPFKSQEEFDIAFDRAFGPGESAQEQAF